jgi:2'-5' RNA ligase
MPRLFSGIEIPDDMRDALARLRQPLPACRWLEPDNYHITLRFAGDVTPPVAREFTANLANINFDPFTVELAGIATFGGDDPRVIFAAIKSSDELEKLARANESAARRAGLKPESRRFIPHITLARLQTAPRIEPIARFLQRKGGFSLPAFTVTRFALYSSKPGTGGGPYIVEQTFPSSIGDYDHEDWADWAEEFSSRRS